MILHQASRRFIRLCIDSQSFKPLLDNNLSFLDLDSPTKTVCDYIKAYVDTYQTWPNADTILDELDVELPKIDNPKFAIDKYKEYLSQQKITEIASSAIDLIHVDTSAAISKFLSVSEVVTNDRKLSSFVSGGKERYFEYRLSKRRGIKGLSTPWTNLNELLGGWVGPSLNVFTGQANIGKSYICTAIARHTYQEGKKVLFVTMEDPTEAMLGRLDFLIHKVSHKDLTRRKLSLMAEIKYRDCLLNPDQNGGDILMASSNEVRTVSDIQMLADTYKPDLVIVDACYRLEGASKAADGWEKIKNIVEDLQRASNRTGLPWVTTTQEKPGTGKSLGNHNRGYQTRYGSDFMIAATNLIALDATEDDRLARTATMHICKIKQYFDSDLEKSFQVNWDLTTGDFSQIENSEPKEIEGIEY